MSEKKPIIIVIEGLIASGKSVLLEVLLEFLSKKGLRVTIVKEPVDKWKASGLLERFYKDPARWGYHFQTKAFHDRVVENIEMFEKYGKTSDVFILERSPFSDTLFMKMLREGGYVDDLEMTDYNEWWSLWYKVMPYEPDLFVYLKPDLEVCMDRLKERGRNGEKGVSVEYQMKLQEKHDEYLGKNMVEISKGHFVPCVTIKTNANYRDFLGEKVKIAEIFEGFVKKLLEKK